MPVRNPWSVWIAVSIFVASAASMPLAYRLLRRPVAPPRTLTQLTELLSQAAPELYVVRVLDNRLEHGIYICTQPRTRDQLGLLIRNPKAIGTPRLGMWQGVVYCERAGVLGIIEEDEIRAWGEYGMQIGPLLFFGDPQLLRRIHLTIFDRQGRNAIPEETAKEANPCATPHRRGGEKISMKLRRPGAIRRDNLF